jgi:ribosomal protein S18 acetylase RimI-like enzyme
MEIKISDAEARNIDKIVSIHTSAFRGFFLTFLGSGFLKAMYRGYLDYPNAKLLVAKTNNDVVGFIAYSWDMSGLYKSFLKKRLPTFAWYGLLGALRSPRSFARIFRALRSPKSADRFEPYVELTSIAVSPTSNTKGVGRRLVASMLKDVAEKPLSYVTLKTDAENNERVNRFYQKCGFTLFETSKTAEGRVMNEYRLSKKYFESALSSLSTPG